MGCDIHLFVEKRVKGRWVAADKWTVDKDDDETPKRKCVEYNQRFYDGRNYNLFSILADVRNGCGFAGIKTGEGFEPIAPPRGLPADVCKEIADESERWGSDGHSHSHFTVAELMAYDWTQVSILQGVVDGITFEQWERYGRSHGESPENYSGGVFGRGIKNIPEEEMRDLIKRSVDEAEGIMPYDKRQEFLRERLANFYTTVQWKQPYYKCADTLLSRTLPRLWRLGSPDDVRIVFWFDN